MKTVSLLFGIALLTSFAPAQSIDPDVIASDGDFFYTAFGSVSYTEGETIVETISNSSVLLTQGFQQPWKLNTTNINESISSNRIVICPNPAFNNFFILSKLNKGTIEICSALGELVYKTNLNSNSQELVPNLLTGVYFVKVSDGANVFVGKLIIQ